MKAITKHIVGENHPNGLWIWVEFKPGKFDWRTKKEAAELTLLQKYEKDNTPELFWAIYQERLSAKTIKLSKPQAEILRRLQNGDVIVIINEHHKSGGDWSWNARAEGGKIYKPFWNLIEEVLRGISHAKAPKGFIVSESVYSAKQS